MVDDGENKYYSLCWSESSPLADAGTGGFADGLAAEGASLAGAVPPCCNGLDGVEP